MANQRRGARRRVWIAAASIAAHLVLIGALALSIRAAPQTGETPAVVVSLIRAMAPRPASPPPQARPRVSPPRPEPAASPAPAPSPVPHVPPPVALPSNAPDLSDAEAARGALRAIVLCPHADDLDMSPAERARCRKVARDLGQGAPTYDVDPHPHGRHDPPVASHGWNAVMGPPPPRPGTLSEPRDCGLTARC